MLSARVRALDDSEAVLRRVAIVLRQLGADDDGEPMLDENGARSQLQELPARAGPSQPAIGEQAARLGALRRGREVLDVLERYLSSRDQSEAA